MHHNEDAASALASVSEARQRLAKRAASPAWYAPAYGLGCGALVASFALPTPLIPVGQLASVGFVLAIYSVWKRQTGLSVNGFRKGKTLPIALGLAAVLLGMTIAAIRLSTAGYDWAPLACGAVVAVVAWLASLAWDRAWLAEITERP